MAGGTLASIGTLGELAIMGVLVAARALLERDRFLEVAVGVALAAVDEGMLAFQGVFRLRVVETLVDVLQRDLLPSGSTMAGRARLRETAVVWVLVAVGAQVEGNARILRLAVGTASMALLAFHLCMQPGQRVTGLVVIELANIDVLPVDKVVAGLAGRT